MTIQRPLRQGSPASEPGPAAVAVTIATAKPMQRPIPCYFMKDNIFFDTCVYHQPGIDLLLKVVPIDNILFASEMVGAVRGVDPQSGHYYDDTKRYIDGSTLSAADKEKIFEGNIRKVFPRLEI